MAKKGSGGPPDKSKERAGAGTARGSDPGAGRRAAESIRQAQAEIDLQVSLAREAQDLGIDLSSVDKARPTGLSIDVDVPTRAEVVSGIKTPIDKAFSVGVHPLNKLGTDAISTAEPRSMLDKASDKFENNLARSVMTGLVSTGALTGALTNDDVAEALGFNIGDIAGVFGPPDPTVTAVDPTTGLPNVTNRPTSFYRGGDGPRRTIVNALSSRQPTFSPAPPEDTGFRNQRLSTFNQAFPQGFGESFFNQDVFNTVLQNILDEQQAGSSELLSNAAARGNLSKFGLSAGHKDLTSQRTRASQRLEPIATGVKERGIQGLEGIRNRAETTATNPDLYGQLFDPAPFQQEAREFAEGTTNTFEEDVRQSLGIENLFRPTTSLQIAGEEQGLVSGAPSFSTTNALSGIRSGRRGTDDRRIF